MRNIEIVPRYTGFKDFYATGSLGRDVYLSESKIHLSCYRGHIRATRLENAMAAGKWCLTVSLESLDTSALDAVLTEFNYDIEAIVQAVETSPQIAEESKDFEFRPGVRARWYQEPSSRTFSPFALDRLKPLKGIPSGKWTLRHVRQALANKQFESFRCTGRYSDDYAYDDQSNYGRGEIRDHIAFLRNLIESPSGWWTSLEPVTNRVSICCHSFDSNSFFLKVD